MHHAIPFKVHRSYSVYFGTWSPMFYIVNEYGEAVMVEHMDRIVYHILGL